MTENEAEGKQTRKQHEKTDALLICPLQMKLGWTGDGTCPVSMGTDRQKDRTLKITDTVFYVN